MDNVLTGKTAVVTGGSRGLGRGIVEALSGAGMRVFVVARGEADLRRLAAEAPGEVCPVVADATDGITALKLIQCERPDVLVLCAGAFSPIQLARYQTWETFSANWDTDVKGTFVWAREALLAPLDPGSTILIVASVAAGFRGTVITGYAAAKTAQVALARSLALEAEPLGIAVKYLLPNLTTHTDLGGSSVRIFARRAGVDEAEIVRRMELDPLLTPAIAGRSVIDILTDPALAANPGYKLYGRGLVALGEGDVIMGA